MKKIKNLLLHILAIFLIILSLGAFSASVLSGILLLLSGIICSPLIRRLVEKKLGRRFKGIVIGVSVAVLFLVGIMVMPTSEPEKEVTAQNTDIAAEMKEPTAAPTQKPTEEPAATPTQKPTEDPAATPTQKPTEEPVAAPTQKPTEKPVAIPTQKPTEKPLPASTKEPTSEPTAAPIQESTLNPTVVPAQETEQKTTDLSVQNSVQMLTSDAGIATVQETVEAPQNENSSVIVSNGTGGNHFGDPIAEGGYIGNKNNHKLHRATCKTLPKESNQVHFDTKEAAVDAGYTDFCKNCNP